MQILVPGVVLYDDVLWDWVPGTCTILLARVTPIIQYKGQKKKDWFERSRICGISSLIQLDLQMLMTQYPLVENLDGPWHAGFIVIHKIFA